MANSISKIKIPSGTVYEVKDDTSRGGITDLRSKIDNLNSVVGASIERREGSATSTYGGTVTILSGVRLKANGAYKMTATLNRSISDQPVVVELKKSDGTVYQSVTIPVGETTTESAMFGNIGNTDLENCYVTFRNPSGLVNSLTCTVVLDTAVAKPVDNISKKLDKPSTEGTAGQVVANDGNGGTEWVNMVEVSAEATQLPEGSSPTVTSALVSGVPTLTFGIPAGATGATGAKGARGDTVVIAKDYADLTFPVYAGKTYCYYNNKPYVANTDIATTEAWTAAHWDEVSFEDEIGDLKRAFQSYNGGTTGQILRKKSNADNDVEWSEVGAPTDEQVQEAVDDYLDAHPEQTTTVVDGSLTEAKFTAQTIVDFKNYVVTPQMYGAKGNGIADDTESVQTALNAHKKVYFPQGTYKITAPLVITAGQTIEGDSKYHATIWAYGCDCIQMTAGDPGERGHIYNIHLRGDYTADSKGIKLAGMAPGWTIDNVWIDGFDYGIYGFNVGHVNNIYISNCIITGQPNNRTAMTAGIYMPGSNGGQTNAITIRDCEINQFESGIVITGTAISILQCTIQSFDNGIVIDSSIGYSTGANYYNTLGCTINGCYFEAFNKSAIYCNTRNAVNNGFSGGPNGLQITNNYIYKDNSGDNTYAVIRFVKSKTYSNNAINIGYPLGKEYAGVFIGMNQISKPNACKFFDIANCLSSDSVIMQSFVGGAQPDASLRDEFGDIKTGARMITGTHIKKEKMRWWELKIWYNSNVTVVDPDTITLNPGGLLRIRFDEKVVGWDVPMNADAYPANRGIYPLAKKATNGLMYGMGSTGFNAEPDTTDWESMAIRGITNGSIREDQIGTDGYYHLITPGQYYPYPNISWNSVSCHELIIFAPGTKTNVITVKAPTIEKLL